MLHFMSMFLGILKQSMNFASPIDRKTYDIESKQTVKFIIYLNCKIFLDSAINLGNFQIMQTS